MAHLVNVLSPRPSLWEGWTARIQAARDRIRAKDSARPIRWNTEHEGADLIAVLGPSVVTCRPARVRPELVSRRKRTKVTTYTTRTRIRKIITTTVHRTVKLV